MQLWSLIPTVPWSLILSTALSVPFPPRSHPRTRTGACSGHRTLSDRRGIRIGGGRWSWWWCSCQRATDTWNPGFLLGYCILHQWFLQYYSKFSHLSWWFFRRTILWILVLDLCIRYQFQGSHSLEGPRAISEIPRDLYLPGNLFSGYSNPRLDQALEFWIFWTDSLTNPCVDVPGCTCGKLCKCGCWRVPCATLLSRQILRNSADSTPESGSSVRKVYK